VTLAEIPLFEHLAFDASRRLSNRTTSGMTVHAIG